MTTICCLSRVYAENLTRFFIATKDDMRKLKDHDNRR
jgi:hypothetical protein